MKQTVDLLRIDTETGKDSMSLRKVKTPPSAKSSPQQESRAGELFVLAAALGDQRDIKGPWTLDDLAAYMKLLHPSKSTDGSTDQQLKKEADHGPIKQDST